MIFPSRTATAPTGTSPSAAACFASASAARMKNRSPAEVSLILFLGHFDPQYEVAEHEEAETHIVVSVLVIEGDGTVLRVGRIDDGVAVEEDIIDGFRFPGEAEVHLPDDLPGGIVLLPTVGRQVRILEHGDEFRIEFEDLNVLRRELFFLLKVF